MLSRIEIIPPPGPLFGEITVPGSKSITNRALILSALAKGKTVLRGSLWSEDTQVMVECLERLGFDLRVEMDPDEGSNRTITVQGLGGVIPQGGTAAEPLELFVGNAGTAARFLTALVCLGRGVYQIRGVPRMHERPQAALFDALRQLGYRIDSDNEKLPVQIHGGGRRPGRCRVDIRESSQFASALLLSSRVGGWEVDVRGENEEEAAEFGSQQNGSAKSTGVGGAWRSGGGYAALTCKMMEAFPSAGGVFQIEPDASSGSYFWASGCAAFLESKEQTLLTAETPVSRASGQPTVRVAHWPQSGWQIDERFKEVFESMTRSGGTISRRTDLGDSIMTGIVTAPLAAVPTRFTDLGRLRLQECERVTALHTELTKCGARVEEEGDTLTVYPSALHGAEIETYNDHRMAMCFSILGLKVSGVVLKNPACVRKTFPNFFQKVAAPPPAGLGVTIVEAGTRRVLTLDELFAG